MAWVARSSGHDFHMDGREYGEEFAEHCIRTQDLRAWRQPQAFNSKICVPMMACTHGRLHSCVYSATFHKSTR